MEPESAHEAPRAPGPAAGRSSRYASISDWRNLDRLPRAPGDGWQARRTRGRTIVGKAAVDKAAARWNPLDPLLIGAPGFTRFLPVLHVAEYRDAAHSRVLGRQRLALFVVVAAAVLLLLSGLMAERVAALRAGVMAFAIAGFIAADYHFVIKRVDALAERALFTVWIYLRGASHALGWSAAIIAAGAVQIYAAGRLGGQDALLHAAGAVNGRVAEAPWRIVVGPLMHNGVGHGLANLAMLAVAAAVVGPMLGPGRTFLMLLAGSTCGAAAFLLLEAQSANDVYLGVSAGIFALLGWLAGASWRRPSSFPAGFAVTAAGFALMNIVIAALASAQTSNAGHLAGWLLGAALGAAGIGGRGVGGRGIAR